MATNKHATIRYHALDKCFSNPGRKFYIEDLINACNYALNEYAGISDGIKRRQIFEDIKFMESEQGWSVPLERLKDGKRVYYRYADTSFSIKKQAINQSEAEQLRETLSILTRFKGMPQFEWIEELLVRIEDTFQLKGTSKAFVDFEQNPYLKGLNHFTELFNAIQNSRALKIEYKGFKQKEASIAIIHPWYLKQYNTRWFLFGYNDAHKTLSNLALDRIISLSDSQITYQPNENIDFDEYFDDVVGVTVKTNEEPQKVLLKISSQLWPYIESKPMHGSQKVKSKTVDEIVIELFVQINHELVSHLFAFMDGVEIIEPKVLRGIFKERLDETLKKYL